MGDKTMLGGYVDKEAMFNIVPFCAAERFYHERVEQRYRASVRQKRFKPIGFISLSRYRRQRSAGKAL